MSGGAQESVSFEGLNAKDLMHVASQHAGLDDFGDLCFVEPLERFLDAVVGEARLTQIGAVGVAGAVVNSLVNRLRLQADLARHPEIREEDVSDPIVIIGLPRTGTTKLQRMMSADSQTQSLQFWRLLNPAPFPDAPPGQPDPRIEVAQQYVGMLSQLSPDFRAGHYVEATEPDEDVFLLEGTFDSIVLPLRFRIPSYDAWWWQRSRSESYAYLRLLLQYLQWQDGGRRGRPWILKTGAHLGSLDTVLELFPQATFVQCHRDLTVTLPSLARLNELFRAVSSDDVDRIELGDWVLATWSEEMRRNAAQRDRLGSRLRILDVAYRDIVDDPLNVIAAAHRLHGRELSEDSVAELRAWAEADAQHSFGKQHSYAAEWYGYTPERIRAAFGGYEDRFADVLSSPGR